MAERRALTASQVVPAATAAASGGAAVAPPAPPVPPLPGSAAYHAEAAASHASNAAYHAAAARYAASVPAVRTSGGYQEVTAQTPYSHYQAPAGLIMRPEYSAPSEQAWQEQQMHYNPQTDHGPATRIPFPIATATQNYGFANPSAPNGVQLSSAGVPWNPNNNPALMQMSGPGTTYDIKTEAGRNQLNANRAAAGIGPYEPWAGHF